MPTIRPHLPQAPQPAASPARTAAQRAFFDAAVGKAAAAPAPSAPPRAETPAPAAVVAPAAPAEAPRKILRPGSLLDIKV